MDDIRLPDRDLPKFAGFVPDLAGDGDLEPAPKSLLADRPSPVAGILTVIEYLDREHNFTRRRIDMLRLGVQWRRPTLYAVCLECEDFRSFRVDRIQCFISPDGEVLKPVEFWSDIGVDPEAESDAYALHRARELAIGPAVQLLCWMADCDGERHLVELERAMDCLEMILEDSGEFLTEQERAWLWRRLNLTFPTRALAQEAAVRLFGEHRVGRPAPPPVSFQRSLMRGMRAVAEADGALSPQEVGFFQDLESRLRAI